MKKKEWAGTFNMEKTDVKRLSLIDSIRGITIISMILYHFCWDLVYILGFNLQWFFEREALIWEQSICMSFIVISGFCAAFSKHTVTRGVKIFILGIIITIVTSLIIPENVIYFGILTLIGSAMFFTGVFKKALIKIPSVLGVVLFFLLFVVTYKTGMGNLQFFGKKLIELPRFLYRNYFTTYLGFKHEGFVSSDYFPIIPWMFLYLCGFYISRIVLNEIEKGKKFCVLEKRIPIFDIIGRHALIIYMLHQVVLYLISFVLMMFFHYYDMI